MELMRYGLAHLEDFAIGVGQDEVQLADSRFAVLRQVNLGRLGVQRLVTLNTSAGAAVLTATGLIQPGNFCLGVTSRVVRGFSTEQGLTGLAIGEASVIDRWGNTLSLLTDSRSDSRHFTVGGLPVYLSATNILVSALGGLFGSTGSIELCCYYFDVTHPS